MKARRFATVTRFTNRRQAGELLAAAVADVVRGEVVVGGIPRGGIAVAAPVAERLRAPLVPIYARKLPSPWNPELAMGAMDDDGQIVLDPWAEEQGGLNPEAVESARRQVWDDIVRRRALYGRSSPEREITGRVLVLVDDGLATGMTMRAAVVFARRHRARQVVVAVPCASTEAARRFEAEADRFVALIVDPDFVAVGAYYDEFDPVEDHQVLALLDAARSTVGTQVIPESVSGKGARHGTQ